MRKAKKFSPWLAAVVAIALCAGLSGCTTNGRHLIFSTYTKLGVEMSFVDQAPRQFIFAYKRFEGAIVPVDKDDDKTEMPSLYAAININSNWLNGLDIYQEFATGSAAVAAAEGDGN